MKRSLNLSLLICALLPGVSAGTIPLFENRGVIDGNTVPPQVDAIAFVNYGYFGVSTTLPYDFQSLLNFTNRGTMEGSSGFQIDQAAASGAHKPASTVVNLGTITAFDGGFFFGGFGGGGGINVFPSYLLVNATKIENRGIMSVGAGGLLQLKGGNLNLSRGGLEVQKISGGTSSSTDTNFFPEAGVTDNYWALTNDFSFDPSAVLRITGTATNVTAPSHIVTNANGFRQAVTMSLLNPASGALLQTITETNKLVQAAFVKVNDVNIGTDIRFARSQIRTNPFRSIVVELSMLESNVVTGVIDRNTLYVTDNLGADTNYVVLTNLASNPLTMRPATYDFSRVAPNGFLTGAAGRSPLTNTMFFDSTMSNNPVTNVFASYSANISPIVSQLPNVAGLSITQYPGRVEIVADKLNLERTRIRGNALVSITANDVAENSTNSVVQVQNLSYNLGAVGHPLLIKNLSQESVVQFGGTVRAYSALWTNYSGSISTNIGPDPADATLTVTNVVTNVVEIGFHIFMLDATGLQTLVPVVTHDLRLTAPEVVMEDAMNVTENLKIDSEKFTLKGRISLSGLLDNFVSTNAPNVRWFTNEGTLDIPNIGTFGTDRAKRYDSFVNRGTVQGYGLSISADSIENSGVMLAYYGQLFLGGGAVKLQGGTTQARGELRIQADSLKMQNYTNLTLGNFVLDVSDKIGDIGEGSNNLWSCLNGFSLIRKPTSGDLLGTVIESSSPKYGQVDYLWAAEDRGATLAGYKNNMAVGKLKLDGEYDSSHHFQAIGPKNAMYVDFLELSSTTKDAFDRGDINSAISIDPGFTIYFADSNVDPSTLQTQSGGRLTWVRDFVGNYSGVDVLVRSSNSTVRMNRSLRESMTDDTDGDGIVNALDIYPLDPDELEINLTNVGVQSPSQSLSFSWEARANATYTVEYATDLLKPEWKYLMDYTNSSTANKTATIADPLAGQGQRYYRVRLNQ